MDADPIFVGEGDIDFARELVSPGTPPHSSRGAFSISSAKRQGWRHFAMISGRLVCQSGIVA
jgi:hypothetical protein